MINAGANDETDAENTQPNLTPLIDVVFMLIVFLLLTANAAQFAVTVDLPQAGSAAPVEHRSLLLEPATEEGGTWKLDGQIYQSVEALRPVLEKSLKENADKPLVIAIDGAASSQRLIDAMDLATEVGAKAVEISAEKRAE